MTDPLAPSASVQGMAIACPPGWIDQSMLVLTAPTPGPGGAAATMVVSRDALPPRGADPAEDPVSRLDRFVDAQRERMGALPALVEVFHRRPTPANPSAELRIEWIAEGLPITQWINVAAAGAEGVLMATATAGRAEFAELEPTFRAMMRSFKPGPA